MGNCQAADVAAAVVHHPDGRSERLHRSTRASQVMAANPGHYVAVIVVAASSRNGGSRHVRYLKLLRPDDALLVGQVYRLVSFEDVLREFGSKRRVRLSRVIAKQKEGGGENPGSEGSAEPVEEQEEGEALEGTNASGVNWGGSGSGSGSGGVSRQGQWRPTLQAIAEINGN